MTSTYRPPQRDIRFVLDEVIRLPELLATDRFGHVDVDTVHGVLDEVGRFMADVVAPTNRDGDRIGSVWNPDFTVTTPESFKLAYKQYVRTGYGAVPFDPEFGGGGFPWVTSIAMQEMLTSANMALSLCPLLTQGAIEALSHHGSDELQHTYLPRMLTGEWSGTMNLTEPQAGSDVGAVRTRAEPAGDGSWRITGQKIFITYGEHDLADNIVHLVLARTPGSPPGTKGISMFLVPKFLVEADGSLGEHNDVTCVSIEHKLGIHGSPTCVLSFGERDGAVGWLIGDEREGMRNMFTMMNTARLSVGLQGLSVAERAYQQALAHAVERRQGRAAGAPAGEQSPIIEHPDVRRMLMTQRAWIDAMRCLLYENAAAVDRAAASTDAAERQRWEEIADVYIPLSKGLCTDLGNEMTSLALQVHGGMGFVEETGAAQHYRDIRIAAIYEGTNGIQAADLVGRKLSMRAGGVVFERLDEFAADADRLCAVAELQRFGENLQVAIGAARTATQYLVERAPTDPNATLSASTP
ncbi:MAG TPA: acyl-CoA dehydrogenase family protein, partial [Ilumatobacteraceae bacterium]|nr:acyl-CoA dehydrogenase family protein [Ilumatobacteraceae bacterium]